MAGRDGTRTPLTRGILLGRFRGVEVVAHWSVLIVVALLTLLLADGVLPDLEPHRPATAY